MSKVTLITSLYKGGKHIEAFLRNVTRQTAWEDCDLFIVDANSPDGEYEVIKRYMADHSNIQYERLRHDPGIYGCWNYIIRNSGAEFLTNANVDDVLFDDCIEKHLAVLEQNPDVDLTYCINLEVYEAGLTPDLLKGDEKVFPTGQFSLYNLLMTNMPHNHPVWRSSLHDRFGYFDTTYHSAADWDFWLRCASLGSQFELIPEKLGIYYRNPEGMSSKEANMDRNLKEVKHIRDKFVRMLTYLCQTAK